MSSRSAGRPLLAVLLCAALVRTSPQVPAPAAVIGHGPGERFTPHAAVVRYCQAVAAAAPDRVRIVDYGRTPGGRPLFLVQVAAPRHIQQLARCQEDLLRLVAGTGDAAERIARMPAVAWLSFNVHGNEASPTEAALVLLHGLLTDAEDQKLLDELVVVIDPCLNPDGRDRYVHWFEDVVGQAADPDPDSVEHEEPWPGGRFNHYRFDLNRDWAFMSQVETRGRIARYLELPAQVHVDFHEMGHNSTYFFFPAAQPVNRHVDARVLRWQAEFGKGNAAAFDGRGWRYYTRESFDLFYPGYGDSWPSLMGAAGMTYEMAGHGRAGRAVRREDGQVLTLRDRLERHLLAARATLQTAARNRAQLLADFERQHREAERLGREETRPFWLIPEGGDPGRVAALIQLLLAQGIQVERSSGPVVARDLLLHDRRTREADRFPAGTWRLRLDQPRGRLLASLLEPDPSLSHLYFYDVSAWSLAMAFGVQAHRAAHAEGSFEPVLRAAAPAASLPAADGPRPYALAIPWHVGDGVLLLERLHEAGLTPFVLGAAVEVDGQELPQGTVLLFQSMHQEDLRATARRAAEGLSCRVLALRTGLTERGPDLGSHAIERLYRPRIALVDGQGVQAQSAGAVWFLFERLLRIPVTRLSPARASGPALDRFNVLILPDGMAPGLDGARLRTWLARGNVAVGMDGGATALARALELRAPTERPETQASAPADRAWRTLRTEEEEQRRRSQPGAIVEVTLDPDSLLTGGYGEKIPVLSSGERGFPLEGYGRVVGFYGEGVRLGGYLPQQDPARRSYAGSGYLNHVPVGRGAAVLFHQDPHFRLVWHGLTQLFLNACFLLPRQEAPPR